MSHYQNVSSTAVDMPQQGALSPQHRQREEDDVEMTAKSTMAAPSSSSPYASEPSPGAYYDANFAWCGADGTFMNRSARFFYPALMGTMHCLYKVGETVAHVTGITQSRFQYAVDEYDRQERKKLQKDRRERDAASEQYRVRGLRGMDDEDADISDLPYAPPLVAEPMGMGMSAAGGRLLPVPEAAPAAAAPSSSSLLAEGGDNCDALASRTLETEFSFQIRR